MNIIVSGSMAYDRIMDFPGHFSDHILPEKLHMINVSFTVNSLTEKFGGTAGNIAYALALLGEKPIIVGTIGRDYQSYFAWLELNGIGHDHIKIIEEEVTACAYITTDKADNQITGFNAGAAKHASSFDLAGLPPDETIVIIAPGNIEDMMNYSRTCRELGIAYIFDPGQSLPLWDGKDLVRCIDGSKLLITNDYELEMVANMTGMDKAALLGLTGTIITTLGEAGSCVSTAQGTMTLPPAHAARVVDPTGAGDAYRAGLIKGFVQGKDMEECARMGGVCASFAIENYGTQEYQFTPAEFEARL